MMASSDLPPEVLTRCHANFIETFRAFARLSPESVVEEHSGLTMVASGLPLAGRNVAIVRQPPPDPHRVVEVAGRFFAGWGLPWRLIALPEVAPGLGAAPAAAGLVAAQPVQGVALWPIPEAPMPPSWLAVERVVDEAGLMRFIETSGRAFEDTSGVGQRLYPPAVLADPEVTLCIGSVAGVDCATACCAISHRIAGLYAVATLPEYRRRGIGEALTWCAAAGGLAEGCLAAYLQTSAMGFGLYQSMGFKLVAQYATWEQASA